MEATTTFICSICGEASRDICIYCTKDACGNHLCERCRHCSDCCLCEMPVFTQAQSNGHKPVVAAQVAQNPTAPRSET